MSSERSADPAVACTVPQGDLGTDLIGLLGRDDSEVRTVAVARNERARPLLDTELPEELRAVDREVVVYVSRHTCGAPSPQPALTHPPQGERSIQRASHFCLFARSFHHHTCGMISGWHRSGKTAFKKLAFADVKGQRRLKPCRKCAARFAFPLAHFAPRPPRPPGDEARPRRARNMWTAEEESRLREGIASYVPGSWAIIHSRCGFAADGARTPLDLKDKYRNICRDGAVDDGSPLDFADGLLMVD